MIEQNAARPYLIEVASGRQFSYGRFHNLALIVARELQERGVGRGDRVALVLNNSVELAVLYFGCLYRGAVAVPVNPLLHAREVEFILKNAGLRLVVHAPSTAMLLPATLRLPSVRLVPFVEPFVATDPRTVWRLPEITDNIPRDTESLDHISEDDLFAITFTSGTTGQPKGVPHRVRSLFTAATLFNEAVGFGPDHRFYHVLAMSYMAGFLNTLLCPFVAGASVAISRPFDAQLALEFWKAPMQFGVNTLWLVPTILATLLRVDRDSNGVGYCRQHVRVVCCGTAPLPAKLKSEFEAKYGVELLESYGLSETLFVSANCFKVPRYSGSTGPVLPTVTVRVGDDGEILIRTPTMMSGYLDYTTFQPDPSTVPEWFPSGDLGSLDTEGNLYITGRKKDLIIRGGINISPRHVEEVLLEHEAVVEAAVIGLPHAFYGEEVAAALRLKPGRTFDTVMPSLEAHAKANLSPTAVPSKWFALDEFPRSSTDKVQKNQLRESLIQ
jgi:long-chain acyl-CoA synthetase